LHSGQLAQKYFYCVMLFHIVVIRILTILISLAFFAVSA
jgi:hypothetical protein